MDVGLLSDLHHTCMQEQKYSQAKIITITTQNYLVHTHTIAYVNYF